MEPQSPAIEMYQKDIEELEKLIGIAIRPNIKRQLIEYKNNLSNLLSEEKKKIEAEKKKKEEDAKKDKTPLQKLNEKLKTNININDKKITLQKEYFNNDFFRMLCKNNFTNLEVLEISCNFITDLKE